MSHPFASVRQGKIEHSRVGHITKGYATGGAVAPEPLMPRKKGGAVKPAMRAEGGPVKARGDRPNRASGGRTKGSVVNVIVAPSGGDKPPMVPPMPMPRPPMAPPPMAPPPMPMRAKGGKVMPFIQKVKPTPADAPMRAKVSQADKPPKAKGATKVSHDAGKLEKPNLDRGAVITKATGGPISSSKAAMAPHAKGGAGGGKSRMDKQNNPSKYEC